MIDIESPPAVRAARSSHQEKKLKKRRELDALVRDVGGGRKRRRVGVNEELLSKEDSSSDSGEGRIHEGVGVTVWRSTHTPRHYTVWWGLKWGLAMGTIFVLATITVWLHVSTRFELDVVRKHIVRVDDDSRSIPETLQLIQSKLQTLQSNQTEVLVNLSDLSKAVTNLQARLDMVNITVNKEGGEGQIKQSVADLGVKVSEIKQSLEVTSNTSNSNTVSINMIATELNSLKLNDIDLRNGAGAPKTSGTSDVSNINSELANLNKSLNLQNQKLNSMNSTLVNVAQNSTVMIDWVKQDVVALQGKVSQLQDDNQNVSSRLASLSERCNSQIQTTLSNMSSLQSVVNNLESQMEIVKNTKPLLIPTVLPTSSTSLLPALPPGLEPLSGLPSNKASQVQTNAFSEIPPGPDLQGETDRKGPRDKRQSETIDKGSGPSDSESHNLVQKP